MERPEHNAEQPYPWDDERLSAYLDGELTAPEYAQLESRLVVDPALRRTVDELCAVRRQLEFLPEYKLENDFAAAVLRLRRVGCSWRFERRVHEVQRY
ncbi:MAG: zf-HC2 domain-containing protein [Pirellulales bacterium]